MLRNVRDGAEVTTLKLARGTVHSASPARSSSTPGSWSSIDAGSLVRSPESIAATPGLQALQGIGVLELLERDDRPTFIIDSLNTVTSNPDPLPIVYANPALQVSDSIRHLLSGEFHDNVEAREEFLNFKAWVNAGGSNSDGIDVFLPSFRYGGYGWTCSTIRNRFRFVSANTSAASIARASPEPLLERESSIDSRARDLSPNTQVKTPSDIVLPDRDYFGLANPIDSDVQMQQGVSNDGETNLPLYGDDGLTPEAIPPPVLQHSFDWTQLPYTEDLPEHIKFTRNIDWAATPLGPIETWSSELRSMANLVMGSPNPAAMYWGPEFTTMYNEAYVALAGAKHPKLMGQPYKDAWGELWPDLQPILESAWKSGQATMKSDDRLILRRNGFDEETFFSWSISLKGE
ncbi:hypothetical protein PC116_g28924 [Phytophthora cactorum]|nr:hypothetical protein PC116_g28924 [Phytophthora cactorum]